MNKKLKNNKKQNKKSNIKTNKKSLTMKRKIFYLLLVAIAMLAIFLNCSCDREEPDVVPPSVPSGFSHVATTTSISLSWSASSDNVGVVGYKIFRDGVSAGNATSTSFTDKNLVPNASYVYTVSAYDAVGNVSKLSSPYTAKTIDDCPTCSKWMTEVNFTAPSVGIISAGEAKSAGSLIVKNISTSPHTANLTLSFAGAGASAVDSLNYTVGGQTFKQKLTSTSVTLNQVSVPANSNTEIKMVYRLKDEIPAGVADQSQITFALTATTTDESGVTQPGNRIFPSVNLDKVKVPAKSAWVASVLATYGEQFAIIGNAVSNELTITINNSASVNKTLPTLTANFGANGSAVKMLRYLNSDGKWVVLKASNGEIVFNNLVLKPGVNTIKSYFALKPQVGVANNSKLEFSFTGLNDGENGLVPNSGKFPNALPVGTVNASVQATVVTSEWIGASDQSITVLPPTGATVGGAYYVGNLMLTGPANARLYSIKLKNPYASVKTLIWNNPGWVINFFGPDYEILVDMVNWYSDYVVLNNLPIGNGVKIGSNNYISIYTSIKNVSATEAFNSGDFTPGLFGLILTSKYDIVLQNSNGQMVDLSDVVVKHGASIIEN